MSYNFVNWDSWYKNLNEVEMITSEYPRITSHATKAAKRVTSPFALYIAFFRTQGINESLQVIINVLLNTVIQAPRYTLSFY